MELVNSLLIFNSLIALSSSMHNENTTLEQYIPVIIDIHKYYSTSTVVFLHSGVGYEDIEIMTLVHSLSRILCREGILTLDIIFARMFRSERYYHRIVRPLYVVILNTKNAVNEFMKAMKSYNSIFPIWFVIFLTSVDEILMDYCYHPPGNIFHLKFNTEMLVMCGYESVIREWYSLEDGLTEINNLGKWEPNHGFALFDVSLKEIFERRMSMAGKVIRAIAVVGGPFVKMKNDEIDGVFGKLIVELSHSINFTLKVVKTERDYGTYNPGCNKWTGAMAEIIAGNADIAIGDFSMTESRMAVVDFTMPLAMTGNYLYVKQINFVAVNWRSYFKVFKNDVWYTIAFLMLTIPLLISVIELAKYGSNINKLNLISERYLRIFGIFCLQGIPDFPSNNPLRLAYFSLFVTAMGIMVHYSASLISFLTVPFGAALPFSTLAEFVDDNTHKVTVLRNSADYDTFAYSDNHLFKQIMSRMVDVHELPTTLIEAFEEVCTKKIALFSSDELKKLVEGNLPCKIGSVSVGRVNSLGMITTKNFPFTGLINYHLQKYLNNGMLKRLKNEDSKRKTKSSELTVEVGIFNIAPVLTIFLSGFVLSIVFLCIENFIATRKKRSSQSKNRTSHERFHTCDKCMIYNDLK